MSDNAKPVIAVEYDGNKFTILLNGDEMKSLDVPKPILNIGNKKLNIPHTQVAKLLGHAVMDVVVDELHNLIGKSEFSVKPSIDTAAPELREVPNGF
ncbi:MAG TPA: hypothetical protein DIS69_07335 [Moraxellaceae bacterium]|nr:hypothetical protein [Moraxella sp.]HCN15861.1 hypothetical protein [Moraxellaceae bacterium]